MGCMEGFVMSKSRILYTDLDIETCRSRFNEDIAGYAGKDFSGILYNTNDFYIRYYTQKEYLAEYELHGTLRQEEKLTKIQYRLTGNINKRMLMSWFLIPLLVPLIIPLIVFILQFVGQEQNPLSWLGEYAWLSFGIFQGISGLASFLIYIIRRYYYHNKLVRFAGTIFNCFDYKEKEE